METAERRIILAELEQRFAKAGEAIFVLRLEHQRLLERLARPSKLLSRQLGVPNPHV